MEEGLYPEVAQISITGVEIALESLDQVTTPLEEAELMLLEPEVAVVE